MKDHHILDPCLDKLPLRTTFSNVVKSCYEQTWVCKFVVLPVYNITECFYLLFGNKSRNLSWSVEEFMLLIN